MARRKAKTEDEQLIPEMARTAVKAKGKGVKLTAEGRLVAKLLDKIMPPEEVDEKGCNLSLRERARIKREVAERRRIVAEKYVQRTAARNAKAVAARKARSATEANTDTDAWKKIPIDKVPTEEPGKYNYFFDIAEAYRAQLKKFKKGGCDLDLVNPLVKEVQEKTCTWIRRVHPEYVQYFAYQFCEWCRDAMIDSTSNARAKEFLAGMWKKILSPRVYPPWECPFDAPMPLWPRGVKRRRAE